MKLIDALLATKPNSLLLWMDSVHGKITLGDLRSFCIDQQLEKWHGRRLALDQMSTLDLVAALSILDGVAESILVLPSEVDELTKQKYLDDHGSEVVLQGDMFGFTQWFAAQQGQKTEPKPIPTTKSTNSKQTAWYLPTSGTTGTPKLIAHSMESLTRSIKKRQVPEEFRWGGLYSYRRFAGIQVFLQCLSNGTPLVLTEDTSELNSRIETLIQNGCNCLSATPSMWRKLAMSPLFDRLNLKQITLGGEIVDQAILDTLAKTFPAARITHIYASTEAGVGFAVSDGKAGFPAAYLKINPFGVQLKIESDGCLYLKDSTEQSIHIDWLNSGDLVRKENDRVYFLGRLNGSINVGGNKVMPEEVEAIISQVPGVGFVYVRGRKNPILGQLVEAVVTPLPGEELNPQLKREILDFCKANLEPFKVPAFIVQGESVNLSATGKVVRV